MFLWNHTLHTQIYFRTSKSTLWDGVQHPLQIFFENDDSTMIASHSFSMFFMSRNWTKNRFKNVQIHRLRRVVVVSSPPLSLLGSLESRQGSHVESTQTQGAKAVTDKIHWPIKWRLKVLSFCSSKWEKKMEGNVAPKNPTLGLKAQKTGFSRPLSSAIVKSTGEERQPQWYTKPVSNLVFSCYPFAVFSAFSPGATWSFNCDAT